VTRLSSPESALKKISDIYTQIESFYETIDLVKKFKDKFNTSYEQASEYESQLKNNVIEFENIKEIYHKTVENLKTLCIFLEKLMQQTAGEFVYEKSEIHAVLERFTSDFRIIQNHHHSLDQELNNAVRKITSGMAYMVREHETLVEYTGIETARITDQGMQIIQNRSDSLALTAQEIREEIYDLEYDINAFLARTAIRLKKRFTGFDKLKLFYKDAGSRLLEIENRSENDFLSILTEITCEKHDIRNLISELGRERLEIRKQNHALKNDVNHAIKGIGHQMSYLANQAEQSGLDNRLLIAQSADQAKYEIRQKLEYLTVESMEFHERFVCLEDDIKAFQSRIKAKLERNIRILNQENKSFLQSADQDAKNRFYKAEDSLTNQVDIEIQKMLSELKNEKNRIDGSIAFLQTQKIEIDETLKNLNQTRENITFSNASAVFRLDEIKMQSEKELKRIVLEFEQEKKGVQDTLVSFEKEKQEIDKRHKVIDYEISSEVKSMGTQMAYMSDQSDRALADLHLLGSQTLDQVKEKTRKEMYRLTLLSDEFKEKFGFLKQDQDEFLSRVNAKINLKAKYLDNQLELWFKDFNSLDQLFRESISRSEKITGILDFEHGRILTEFEHEKAGLRNLLTEFSREYRELESRHHRRDREISETVKEMTTHMAYISEQAQKVFQDTGIQTARFADEQKYRIRKELDRLTLTTDEFRERFNELEEDLNESQSRIKSKLERKVSFFSKGLNELLGRAHNEVAKLSEKSCKEQVTAFIEEQKKELPDFENLLKDFEKQIWENSVWKNIDQKIENISIDQENFQKKAGQAIVKKLAQEILQIKKELDTQVNSKIKDSEIFTDLNKQIEKLSQSVSSVSDKYQTGQYQTRLEKIEQELAELKQDQENSDTDQKKREADIRAVLKKIYEGQKKHTAALLKMEKQINVFGARFKVKKKTD